MLPITVGLGHLPKARSDTCPQGPPRFPGRGWQRIPQMKVKLFLGGLGGVAQENTVGSSVAGLHSLVGMES